MGGTLDCYTIGICSSLELGTTFTVAVRGIRPNCEAAAVIGQAAGPDAYPLFAKETFVPRGEDPFYPDTAEQFLVRHRNTDPSLGVISVLTHLSLDSR